MLLSSESLNTEQITCLVGIASLVISLFIYWGGQRDNEKSRLNENLNNILNTGIEHPYLEDKNFIDSLSSYTENEKAIRYDLYCIMWFNFIEQVYRHHYYQKSLIQDFINVEEIVKTHRTWWIKNDGDNKSGYKSMGFEAFINSYLA